jgi:hypothetical protein
MLGIPTGGSPAAPFLESLGHLTLPDGVGAIQRAVVTGNFVPAQRDLLLERAIESGAGVLVMADDDMILPPNALQGLCALLEARPDCALAGALYYSRDGLRPMTVDGWDPSDSGQGWIPAFGAGVPVEVAGVGFGCVAIRIDAVRDFERPFFASQIFVERAAQRVRVCNEDYLFCHRLRTAGRVVMLHPGVRCGHYDRATDRIAPHAWEPDSATAMPRVLSKTGDRYRMIPLADAPAPAGGERHVAADVTYVLAEGYD